MLRLDTFQSLFHCPLCSRLLVDPIVLPCGETVCKLHIQDKDLDKCPLCSEQHLLPKNGFPANKVLNNLLEIQLNTLNMDKVSYFKDCKNMIQKLKANLEEIEVIQSNPTAFIAQVFDRLKRQVYRRRDEITLQIDECSNAIIEEVEKYHKECAANVNTNTEATEMIDLCKSMLEELILKFDSFQIDNTKYEEILKNCKELKKNLNTIAGDYKYDLVGKQSYSLVIPELKIDEVFGSLALIKVTRC